MKKLPIVILFSLLFSIIAFSQSPQTGIDNSKTRDDSSNVLEKVDLRFDLEGIPNPQDAGFDYPKGKWKLEYELRLSDEKTLSDFSRKAYMNCRENTSDYQKCVKNANRNLRKKVKKTALFIAKGKLKKTPVSAEADRTVIIPVEFTPDVINILNKSLESKDNPTFVMIINGRFSSKTPDKKKINHRYSITFHYPLKQIRKDNSFDFYNITVMGATVRISYENSKLIYGIFRN
ncbi:MAG: hypothetical protein ACR2L1_00215 [Pyrinomonadaceae bacterium]